MIQLTCGGCRKTLSVADEMAGKRGKCPKCKTTLIVPAWASGDDGGVDLDALSKLVDPDAPPPPPARSIVRLAPSPSLAAGRKQSTSTYDLVTTRRCPYCDEEIQASAKKCKHCGEWIDRRSPQLGAAQRSTRTGRLGAAGANGARSYLNAAVVTLILYVLGLGITGLVANLAYLSSAKRVERETGITPEGKGCLVALMWVFVWLPLIVGVLIVLVILAGGSR